MKAKKGNRVGEHSNCDCSESEGPRAAINSRLSQTDIDLQHLTTFTALPKILYSKYNTITDQMLCGGQGKTSLITIKRKKRMKLGEMHS